MDSVAVVIPCYRSYKTIERCLLSVLNQSFIPNEIIFIDDFSNDDQTVNKIDELINTFSNKYNSINFIFIKLNNNIGPGNARNVGWDVAASKWLAFLDSDDIWCSDKLEVQLKFLDQNPSVDMICGKSLQLNNSRIVVNDKAINMLSIYSMLFKNKVKTRTVVLRKEIKFRFFNNNYTEDFLLWIHLLYNRMNCFYLNYCFAYSINPEYSNDSFSSNLVRHEIRELNSFIYIYNKFKINKFIVIFAIIFSVIKFFVRLSKKMFAYLNRKN